MAAHFITGITMTTLRSHRNWKITTQRILAEKQLMVSLETSSDFPIYVTDTVHFVGFYLKFLPNFSQQNWRVIFEGFQSNFNFAWLNSTSRSLGWENASNKWKMFTNSLRSYNFKSGSISGKIRHCVTYIFEIRK